MRDAVAAYWLLALAGLLAIASMADAQTILPPPVSTGLTASGSRYPNYKIGASYFFIGNEFHPLILNDTVWTPDGLDTMVVNIQPRLIVPPWKGIYPGKNYLVVLGNYLSGAVQTADEGAHTIITTMLDMMPITLGSYATVPSAISAWAENVYCQLVPPDIGLLRVTETGPWGEPSCYTHYAPWAPNAAPNRWDVGSYFNGDVWLAPTIKVTGSPIWRDGQSFPHLFVDNPTLSADMEIKTGAAASGAHASFGLRSSRLWNLVSRPTGMFELYDASAGATRMTVDAAGVFRFPALVNGYACIVDTKLISQTTPCGQ